VSEERSVKRIVVALEPSVHGLAALEAAAEMASRLGAELLGVYVEDIDLLRAAGLPFAEEFSLSSARRRALDSPAMERTLRAEGQRLEKALETAARRAQVRATFRVLRGRVPVELLTAGEEGDMLIVGKASVATTRRVRCGSTARAIVSQYKRTVVVLQRGVRFGRPVAVVFDGSEASRRALLTAAGLAQHDHKNVVALITGRPEAMAELEDAARSGLATLGLEPRCVRLPSAGLEPLIGALKAADCRTLVLGADAEVLTDSGTEAVLEAVDCPVVLVR
jgi:nucleotide-binding universal stress UspA family protein